ncbi:MAG: IS5 family transposase [Planctomycetota bacterium]|jgi:IS5 family transposase
MNCSICHTTLAESTFAKYKKPTRKEKFLAQMDEVIPWKELSEVIKPHYLDPKGSGRRPIGIERMLRIHFMQYWFNLSDPGMEEALYDIPALREFARIDLGREPAPDETTICKFRHILESNDLGERLFHLVNKYLSENGLFVSKGTIVDATLIEAPTLTKNKEKQQDPDMHQTRKGNQWYFGMKTHIGVDSQSKLIYSVAVTPANTHDSQVLEDLLRGGRRGYGETRPIAVRRRHYQSTHRMRRTMPRRRGHEIES